MLRIIFSAAMLFLVSGAMLLLLDRKVYQVSRRAREQKISSLLGWFNLSAALILLGIFLWKH
ncbi:CLC_0170 family protein [Paenibacillus brevis]|uniref:Uncharacterized protein n=1 Tax=Paenibacillus brevis TaxID=2841508 RepID=A0ABS6FNU8_9BACL|nr:CLC_0170 family protein [Paenibacillus brevis]MBU5671885.1 hypothetical protein [Paenibacillus brevis]